VFLFKLPPPLGTPSYPRGRVVYLVFEDGGVPKHQQNKNLPDSNKYEYKKLIKSLSEHRNPL
jgi:hypothetical protein